MSNMEDVLRRAQEKNKKIEDFGELLDSLTTTDEKRKMLWKEIYQNAVTDRENAYALYISLYQTLGGSAAEHATHGGTLVKYLERMGKATEQIIKLAEMIKSTEDEESQLSPDDIFNKISRE